MYCHVLKVTEILPRMQCHCFQQCVVCSRFAVFTASQDFSAEIVYATLAEKPDEFLPND
jgi:hypothetical protein